MIKITEVFRNLALGLAITASGLILETPAHAEGKYWYSDQGKYTDEQHAYTYLSVGGDMITTDDINLARKYAIGDIQTKDGILQNTQEDRNKAIEQEKINKQLEMQKPENQPISYEEFYEDACIEMCKLVNDYREENGLDKLKIDNNLMNSAKIKSQHMIDNNYYSHNWKGLNWLELNHELSRVENIGENIYKYYEIDMYGSSAKDVAKSLFDGWKASPGHRANMLNKAYTKFGFGFGITYDKYGKVYYATQHFQY